MKLIAFAILATLAILTPPTEATFGLLFPKPCPPAAAPPPPPPPIVTYTYTSPGGSGPPESSYTITLLPTGDNEYYTDVDQRSGNGRRRIIKRRKVGAKGRKANGGKVRVRKIFRRGKAANGRRNNGNVRRRNGRNTPGRNQRRNQRRLARTA